MTRFLPLVLFIIFAGFFTLAIVRQRDPAHLASVLIDRPLPVFKLTSLDKGQPDFSNADIAGGVAVINFFASWCLPCRVEQPALMELRDKYHVRIFGVNYKDKPQDARVWLKKNGNPFARVGMDLSGQLALDMGVAGVPESFVIGKGGNVIYRHAGPLMPDDLRAVILPLLVKEGL